MGDLSGDHDQELTKSKEVQKVVQTLWDHKAGSDWYYSAQASNNSAFVTVVT